VTHRFIVEARRALRNGKTTRALELCHQHASAGEHVHYGFEICWNGDSGCDKFVKERFQWNGEEHVPVVG
jgi:hypothetical protein